MKELNVTVLENKPLTDGVFRLKFSLPEKINCLRCGKFVNISVGDKSHLLRRPIAICEYDDASVTICYQLKGDGTRSLSKVREGETLSCILPLGNGFKLEESHKRIALVGGGVGIFPMVSVLREYENSDREFYSYIGFRNSAAVCMESVFKNLSEHAEIVTDDGSYGKRSNAVSAFSEDIDRICPDVILSCGPTPMLRALKKLLTDRKSKIPCYVSLEERMACGIGACLVCVCQKEGGEENARVCKDGPVFEIGEVIL